MEKNGEDHIQPVLVLLHYFGGSAKSWQFVISKLESYYSCIAIDLPGFGNTAMIAKSSLNSYADFVRQELIAKGVTHYILIGHSMGGKIALQCAVDDYKNEQLRGLILVAPSPPSFEDIPESEQAKMREIPDIEQSKSKVEADTVIRLTDEGSDVAINTPLEVAADARKWWIDEGTRESIADNTRQLNVPVTLIVSKDDPAINWAMTREQTLPNLPLDVEILTIDTIGHLMPLENPTLIASMISETLNKKK
ncbi:alpha/beta fold hydrolase [Pedobacter terrae]|uniref:alpha/beta fold hydrolase n=1 Tax=Pedobacter terrae TaxID=405671 RepID=UPI002FFCBA89